MDLIELGWKEHFKKHFAQLNTKEYIPARVATAQREKYILFSSFGILQAEMTGKMRFNAVSIGERLGLSKQEAFMMLKGVVPNKMWQAMSYEFEGV